MKYTFIFLILFFFFEPTLFAQQMPISTVMPNYLWLQNPACVGMNRKEGYDVRFSHRNQWLPMKDAPTNQFLAMDKSFDSEKIGIGFIAFNDKRHLLSQQGFQLAYAYRFPFGNQKRLDMSDNTYVYQDWLLSFGLGAGLLNQRLDLSEAIIKNPNDRLLMPDQATNSIKSDVSFGGDLMFKYDKSRVVDSFHLGMGMRHIPFYANFQDSTMSSLPVKTHYTSYATYVRNWRHSNLKMEYIALYRFNVPQMLLQLDLSGFLHHKKYGFMGGGWKTDFKKSSYWRAMLGITYLPKAQLMYIYENALTSGNALAYSSHEFALSFQF
jgi:type IX secretion system PorP/SprF family membrane protein